MSNNLDADTNPNQAVIYRIKIQERLDAEWRGWFDGLTIIPEYGGGTLITGPVRDQSALHGLLKRVRDLGLTLVSVNPIDKTEERY